MLSWALGQHPNLLVTEESNWLGNFATQAAAAYVQGCARGPRSQLSALGITRAALLGGLGDAINRIVLSSGTLPDDPAFAASRTQFGKARWVDGTPEYSLQIYGLLALFPRAMFVHILRDADEVAASLLAFRDEFGRPLVTSTEAAYSYWLRTVRACVVAEDALGPHVVHRVHHMDLITEGERTLRGIFQFLDEPFASACLEPLKFRINSSFPDSTMPRIRPSTGGEVVGQARRLSEQLLASRPNSMRNLAVHAQLQAEFEMGVQRALTLEADRQATQLMWEATQQMLVRSRVALNICCIALLTQWVAALAFRLESRSAIANIWLMLGSLAVLVLVWLRRAGLRAIARRLLSWTTRLTKKSA